MGKTLNVFILAAGLGERLQPITYHIPKPLLPILGKPILQYILENVSTLSVDKIGINLHHKKEAIENWIIQGSFSRRVELFPEEPILGTGGALKNAESFLRSSTFLVYNSDILSDMNLGELLEYHLSSKNLVTLAVHDFPRFNSLVIDKNGFLKGIERTPAMQSGNRRLMAFTGISVCEPEFLRFIPSGASSVVDGWLNAIGDGCRVGALGVNGCYWSDIGTPFAYAFAVFDTLRIIGETIYVHPSTRGCDDVDLRKYVAIENKCVLGKGISLRNCIILPESRVESGLHYENCIIGHGFKIDFNEAEIPGLSVKDDKSLIGTGGSDRRYYRVKKGEKSAVLMQCDSGDPDFQRQVEYARFFQKYSIPVPELLEVKHDRMEAIFEDAGDISLYTWLKCPHGETQIENIYKQALEILVLIHTIATEHVTECRRLKNMVFDYKHFRWETGYFVKRFVEGIRNIKIKNSAGLQEEFHRLALKADSFSKTVIHRDFQSQNIMVMKGEILRLIDYQGARLGPPAYDIASLLWDPYYRLRDDIRRHLINYYIDRMKAKTMAKFNEKYFMETLPACRLQRHMQALGAYGFLSLVKGKKYFLKYVSEGLSLIKEDATTVKDEYPELYNLVMQF